LLQHFHNSKVLWFSKTNSPQQDKMCGIKSIDKMCQQRTAVTVGMPEHALVLVVMSPPICRHSNRSTRYSTDSRPYVIAAIGPLARTRQSCHGQMGPRPSEKARWPHHRSRCLHQRTCTVLHAPVLPLRRSCAGQLASRTKWTSSSSATHTFPFMAIRSTPSSP
jgi:hypothetical protein